VTQDAEDVTPDAWMAAFATAWARAWAEAWSEAWTEAWAALRPAPEPEQREPGQPSEGEPAPDVPDEDDPDDPGEPEPAPEPPPDAPEPEPEPSWPVPELEPAADAGEINLLIRGQSNAKLFAERGGAEAMATALEEQTGAAVNVLAEDGATYHAGSAFTEWDDGGQTAGLAEHLASQPDEVKDNPTLTVWMHNESDQQVEGLTAEDWEGEVRADAEAVRAALGQGAETTPVLFVPINYPYGEGFQAISDGMEALAADETFNAAVSDAALGAAMDGGPEPGPFGSHLGDEAVLQLGEQLGQEAAPIVAGLAGAGGGGAPEVPSPPDDAPADVPQEGPEEPQEGPGEPGDGADAPEPPEAPQEPATGDLEGRFLDLLNGTRAEAGQGPLSIDPALDAAADGHTAWMLEADTFDHTGEGGSSAGDRADAAGFDGGGWGENIAYRSTDGLSEADVEGLHQQLVDSPGHYENIVGDYDVIGFGLAEGDFEGGTVAMVTEVFGAL
jgi:uncharacterized protein YkwD